jgi:hypothetical protein
MVCPRWWLITLQLWNKSKHEQSSGPRKRRADSQSANSHHVLDSPLHCGRSGGSVRERAKTTCGRLGRETDGVIELGNKVRYHGIRPPERPPMRWLGSCVFFYAVFGVVVTLVFCQLLGACRWLALDSHSSLSVAPRCAVTSAIRDRRRHQLLHNCPHFLLSSRPSFSSCFLRL